MPADAEGIVTRPSPYSAADTVARLEALIAERRTHDLRPLRPRRGRAWNASYGLGTSWKAVSTGDGLPAPESSLGRWRPPDTRRGRISSVGAPPSE